MIRFENRNQELVSEKQSRYFKNLGTGPGSEGHMGGESSGGSSGVGHGGSGNGGYGSSYGGMANREGAKATGEDAPGLGNKNSSGGWGAGGPNTHYSGNQYARDTQGGHGGGGAAPAPAPAPASSDDSIMDKAKTIAQAEQAGMVNSAYGASMEAGLSPTQSALVGAKAGASGYQAGLGSAYNTGVQQQVGMAGVNLQKQENQNNFLGSLFSAGAGLLSIIGLQHGSDNTSSGPTLVGENGPEIVNMPKGAKVVPNIKDGYDMLNHISQNIKNKTINNSNAEVSNTSMIQALNDKLDKAFEYMKTIKPQGQR